MGANPKTRGVGEDSREAYPWYVGRPSDARTSPSIRFIIPLGAGFAVIQIAVLPIQPGMSQLMGKNIPAAGHRKPFADVNGLGLVVPDPIRIGVTFVHFRIGELPDRDAIAERQDDPPRHT